MVHGVGYAARRHDPAQNPNRLCNATDYTSTYRYTGSSNTGAPGTRYRYTAMLITKTFLLLIIILRSTRNFKCMLKKKHGYAYLYTDRGTRYR